MSKALPITIAVLLGGAALVPIYYATQNSTESKDTQVQTQTAKVSGTNVAAVEKISYALGYEVAGQTPPDINENAFIKGYRSGRAKEKPIYTEQELQAAYVEFQTEMQQKQVTLSKAAEVDSQKFLTENATKPGVVTMASGLQYKITQPGTGKQPTAKSKVTVHYKGQFVDGKVFDSSLERGEPVQFALDKVLPGWTEAFPLFKEGTKATLYIPAKLAYGEQGIPGQIPGNSALIFDVELIQVN